MTRAIISSTIVAFFLFACVAEDADSLNGGRAGNAEGEGAPGEEGAPGAPGEGTTPGADPTQPGTCKEGVPHVGFANFDFVSDRKAGAIGDNRRRVKPYSALASEFQRALGRVPGGLASNAAAVLVRRERDGRVGMIRS